MYYYVIAPDGQKYGPADLSTLNAWAIQGRILPNTILEEDGTGRRLDGNQVLGLVFPTPNNPMGGTPPKVGGGYGNQYQSPPGPVSYPRNDYFGMDDGADDLKKAWIFGTVGLLCAIVSCFPLVFGSLGIYFASTANRKGNPRAQAALIYCICTLVIGIGLSIVLRFSSFG